jgi:hypothetical protein
MCTYDTHQVAIEGSGKGRAGWFALSQGTVYYDHPVHAFAEHTLNIDFAAPEQGPAARVAVELTAESAVRLVGAVAGALVSAPRSISGLSTEQVAALRELCSAPNADEVSRQVVGG